METQLEKNIQFLQNTFSDCGDFVGRMIPSGGTRLYMAYFDGMTDRNFIDLNIIKTLVQTETTNFELLPTVDLTETGEMETVLTRIMAGDTVVFIDNRKKAVIIASKGFPSRGVNAAETEVVVQGSKESFSEGLRINTALVRRRIRDTSFKVKQIQTGRRSKTDIALLYIEGIVRPNILQAVEQRIAEIDIDAVLDSGSLEQHIESDWLSPFPQAQLTERPDKAASAVLEGRIAIIVDNSPFALIVPVTLNCFFQSSEDYYNRWQIMSLARLIRFGAALMTVMLPGLYIAVAIYHPSMIPMLMATKLAAASQNVPFPAIVEILLMDAAFELLREAGVRLPGAVGGTIGIVGGLIIGQAAVEAGVVSPIVVIIVALTGVAAFAIPHVSLVYGFRLVKYAILLLSAVLGFLGFWAGLLLALIHLASLRSFGVPYLMPFAAGELSGYVEARDSIFRFPLFTLKKRPFFARKNQRTRMGD